MDHRHPHRHHARVRREPRHPDGRAFDAAKLHGIAILKLDGKADKMYVRCADGTVRSAKSPLAVEALAAHAKA